MEEIKDLVPENTKRIKLSKNGAFGEQSTNDNSSSDMLQKCDDPALPMEIMLKIISHLSDTKDLINCFCISKDINQLIYNTPEIMRKILYKLTCRHNDQLLIERGMFIKRLQYAYYKDDRYDFLLFLENIPNVEDLTLVDIGRSRYYDDYEETASNYASGTDDGSICDDSDYDSSDQYANFKVNYFINLLKLQSLSISNKLRVSIKCLLVENLFKLSITFVSYYQCFAIFVDFFCQLENLKEISLEGDLVFRFPNIFYKDIVQCKLRKIEISFEDRIENNNFARFLKTQAAEIEELNLNLKLNEEELDVIFMKFLKLERLTLGNKRNYDFLSNEHPEWELPSLIFYKHSYGSNVNLSRLTQKFPNLESFVGHDKLLVDLENFGQNFMNLKIKGIHKLTNGQFLTINLSSIEVEILDLDELKNAIFPNLTELKAALVVNLNEKNWKEFTAGLLSIEKISLENLKTSNIDLIFKHLKDNETLNIIELSFNNEKLIINLTSKTVNYSWSKSCESSCYKDLLEIFKGFDQLDWKN